MSEIQGRRGAGWPDWANFRPLKDFLLCKFLLDNHRSSQNFRATFLLCKFFFWKSQNFELLFIQKIKFCIMHFWQNMGWATFWATFSRTHQVTLIKEPPSIFLSSASCRASEAHVQRDDERTHKKGTFLRQFFTPWIEQQKISAPFNYFAAKKKFGWFFGRLNTCVNTCVMCYVTHDSRFMRFIFHLDVWIRSMYEVLYVA
jgi:hypothetical protein